MKNQLDLFEKKMAKPKKVCYASLDPHQKINYKANECGFQSKIYLSHYNFYEMHLYQAITDYLTEDYQIHYKINAGGFNRLDHLEVQKKLFN